MGLLDGKVAIITGAGGGIGSVTASLLAAEGASVVVADIDAGAGLRVAEQITTRGDTAMFCEFDALERTSFQALADTTIAEYGRIDVLHNNAAGTHLYGLDQAIGDIEPESWDSIFALNLRSVLFGCQVVAPTMVEQGSGSIVNMSSTRATLGALDLAAYGASKSAIDSLTRYVATQYGRAGIRCNSVQPGLILTEQAAALHADGDGLQKLTQHVCLPYAGTP